MSRAPLLLLALAACASGDGRGELQDSAAAALPASRDSMILEVDDSTAVWFTLERAARDASGAECTERGIEIRQSGRRRLVPLLYTRDVPMRINDSTLAVDLFRDCVPVDAYRIDIRTGQPTPAREATP